MVKNNKKPKTLKEALEGKLTKKQLELFGRSYDIIGDIAIIEIPDALKKKEKMIAKTLLDMHPNIKVVCKKIGMHEGIYRTQKMKIIGGERRKETIHKENLIRMKLDIEKVYFSPRLGTERKRIAEMVKKREKILVMFSGCGPYPLIISKNSDAKEISGIEINPDACKYAQENLILNKIHNVKLFCGDVVKVMPGIKEKFDRIVMPLPMTGGDFLGLALKKIKKNGVVHFYVFLPEQDIKIARKIVWTICKENKKKYRILNLIKCGQYAPRTYRICVDFKVLN